MLLLCVSVWDVSVDFFMAAGLWSDPVRVSSRFVWRQTPVPASSLFV